MDPAHVPALAVVPHGAEMRSREAELTNAIVATDIRPANLSLRIRDIATALDKHFGVLAKPVEITHFAPDFVIRFATLQEKNVLAQCGMLYGDNFTARLLPWTDQYRARIIYWHTEVAIDTRGFPPQACNACCLEPLLSSYCSVQACSFNRRRGTCRVDGYALNTASIPSHGRVSFQHAGPNGIANITFPVMMQAYLLSEAPEFKDDQADSDSAGCFVASNTTPEMNIDGQPSGQPCEQQHRNEGHIGLIGYYEPDFASQNLNRDDEATSHASIFHPTDLDLHDPWMAGSAFDEHGCESDRSWKLHYQR